MRGQRFPDIANRVLSRLIETKEVPAKTPPTNVCTAPNGDATSLKNKVEHWLKHSQAVYGQTDSAQPAACASAIDFVGTSTDGILDTGWTGNGHDSTVVSDGHVTVRVSNCTTASVFRF